MKRISGHLARSACFPGGLYVLLLFIYFFLLKKYLFECRAGYTLGFATQFGFATRILVIINSYTKYNKGYTVARQLTIQLISFLDSNA